MNELNTISFKFKEICKKYSKLISNNASYYHKEITDEINRIIKLLELQNQIAALSNSNIADALMDTIKHIAYAKAESNYDTCYMYLEEAIKDLMSGMDAVDVLWKYDKVLYDLRNPKQEHRGYRAKILIVDDLCDIDKEELKEILKERGYDNNK